MKFVAYCRVARATRTGGEVPLEIQRKEIAAWCAAKRRRPERVYVETMSGDRIENRPELLKAVALACKVKGVLVVFSLNRLAQTVKDTLVIAARLEAGGANLASLTERTDTSSADGKKAFRRWANR